MMRTNTSSSSESADGSTNESRRGRVRRLAHSVALVLGGLVAATLVGETVLRVWARWRPSMVLTQPDAGVSEKITRSRFPPGTVRHGYPVNSGGHYDDEFHPRPEVSHVVAAIGDSFSAGVVHHSRHFTTVAERELGDVAVYNFGFPAIDPPEYHHLLVTEVLVANPDLIIVNLFVGNDLSYPTLSVADEEGAARWFDPSRWLMIQAPRRLLILAAQSRSARQALAEVEGSETVLRTDAEVERRYPWYDELDLEPTTLDRWTYLRIERDRARRLCRQPEDEITGRLEILHRMRAATRDVPMAVMIIPDVFQVEDELWREVAPEGADQRCRDRSVVIVRRWLEANGFAYLDLLPVLRGIEPLDDGWRRPYKRMDTHFNARGNELVGQALALFIRDLLSADSG